MYQCVRDKTRDAKKMNMYCNTPIYIFSLKPHQTCLDGIKYMLIVKVWVE